MMVGKNQKYINYTKTFYAPPKLGPQNLIPKMVTTTKDNIHFCLKCHTKVSTWDEVKT